MRIGWLLAPLCSCQQWPAVVKWASAEDAESSRAVKLVIRNGTVIDGTGADPIHRIPRQ